MSDWTPDSWSMDDYQEAVDTLEEHMSVTPTAEQAEKLSIVQRRVNAFEEANPVLQPARGEDVDYKPAAEARSKAGEGGADESYAAMMDGQHPGEDDPTDFSMPRKTTMTEEEARWTARRDVASRGLADTMMAFGSAAADLMFPHQLTPPADIPRRPEAPPPPAPPGVRAPVDLPEKPPMRQAEEAVMRAMAPPPLMGPIGLVQATMAAAPEAAHAGREQAQSETEAALREYPRAYLESGLWTGLLTSPSLTPAGAMAGPGGLVPLGKRLIESVKRGMPQTVAEAAVAGAAEAGPGESLVAAGTMGGLTGAATQAVLGPAFELAGTLPRMGGEAMWGRAKSDVFAGGSKAAGLEEAGGGPRLLADPFKGEEVIAGLAPDPATREVVGAEVAKGGRGFEIQALDRAADKWTANLIRAIDEFQVDVRKYIHEEKQRFFNANPGRVSLDELSDSLMERIAQEPDDQVRKGLLGLLGNMREEIVDGEKINWKTMQVEDRVIEVPREMTAEQLDDWQRTLTKRAGVDEMQTDPGIKDQLDKFIRKEYRPFVGRHFGRLNEINEAASEMLKSREDIMGSLGFPKEQSEIRPPDDILSEDFATAKRAALQFGGVSRVTHAVRNLAGEVSPAGADPVKAVRRFLKDRPDLLEGLRKLNATKAFLELGGKQLHINQIISPGAGEGAMPPKATGYIVGAMPTIKNRLAGMRSIRPGGPAEQAARAVATTKEASDAEVELFMQLLLSEKEDQQSVLPPPALQLGAP